MAVRALLFLLVGCASSGAPVTAADPTPITPSPAATLPLAPAASAVPAAAPLAEKQGPPPASSAEHGASKAEATHGEHHEHSHGKAGYHMDFSEVERFARHFDGPERDAWQKPAEVVRFLDLRVGQVIADIGAGTGYFLPHLSKTAGPQGRVLALDVEPNMVEYIKQRSRKNGLGNVEARVVAPDDPGLAPGSVDHILIVNTWHHIDDRSNYAAKLARALRPSGSLLIVDFTLESDQGPPKEHRLTAEQVAKELEGGGFRAEIVRGETLPKQYLVRGSIDSAGSR